MIASILININFKQASSLKEMQAISQLEDEIVPEVRQLIDTLKSKGIDVKVTGPRSIAYDSPKTP